MNFIYLFIMQITLLTGKILLGVRINKFFNTLPNVALIAQILGP